MTGTPQQAEGEYHARCLISNSPHLTRLAGYEKDYLVKSSPVGFVFCQKVPTAAELQACYEGYYRHHTLSPVTVQRYHHLLDVFERFRNTNNILDVGCGSGYFLKEAKKRGWAVYGTEYTDDAVKVCEAAGLCMLQGKLNPDAYRESMFDIVTSFEVLEHIYNPQEEISNIKKILRPEGLFYFTTPNFNSIERRWLKGRFNVINYPEHLCYYTPRTAHYLMTKHGFEQWKLTTTGISFSRILASRGGRQYQPGELPPDELVRRQLEKNYFTRLLKKGLNKLLNFFSLGLSLKGWYINKKP